MSRHLGLIIGINQYQDSTFQSLVFAENDARALAQWLVNTKGGKWAPSDVQHVYGRHATKELIETLISQLCLTVATSDDIILIYFAGHAFIDERSGEGYLALQGTSYHNPATGLHLLSLAYRAIARSRAARVLCILDCFHTGSTQRMRRSSPFDSSFLLGPQLLNALQQQRERLFLCSCRGNEIAAETGERGLGMFAYRTIIGLCGPASDPAGNITLQHLLVYLANTLNDQHRPQLFGQEQPPLILVDAPAPPTPPSTPPTSTDPFMRTTNTRPFEPHSGQYRAQSAPFATTTSPVYPQERETPESGPLFSVNADQQKQQQCQHMLTQAQQLFQAQNYTEAFNCIEYALRLLPGNVAALTLKAQLLGTVGRYQEALAAVEQLVQEDPGNALAWSMRAVLLTNIGQYPAALDAIEHSLELNATNPETFAIKTNIMANIATTQSRETSQQLNLPELSKRRGSIFLNFVAHLAGFLLGIIGISLPFLLSQLPVIPGFGMASLGLALLCVAAPRGTYRYGFLHLVPSMVTLLLSLGIIGAMYEFGYTAIVRRVQAQPTMTVAVLFIAGWLVTAAILPFLLAMSGLIISAIRKKLKRAR